MDYGRAFTLAEIGFKRWAEKYHNKKWVKLLDGTPIVNDLLVNIAIVISETSYIELEARDE